MSYPIYEAMDYGHEIHEFISVPRPCFRIFFYLSTCHRAGGRPFLLVYILYVVVDLGEPHYCLLDVWLSYIVLHGLWFSRIFYNIILLSAVFGL